MNRGEFCCFGCNRVVKPDLHINRKDCKHMFASPFLDCLSMAWSPYIAVMITSGDLSQEIFATDMLTALKFSLENSCKRVLRLLRL